MSTSILAQALSSCSITTLWSFGGSRVIYQRYKQSQQIKQHSLHSESERHIGRNGSWRCHSRKCEQPKTMTGKPEITKSRLGDLVTGLGLMQEEFKIEMQQQRDGLSKTKLENELNT